MPATVTPETLPSDALGTHAHNGLWITVNAVSVRWQTTDAEIMRLLGSDVPSATSISESYGSSAKTTSPTPTSDPPSTAAVLSGPTMMASQSTSSEAPTAMQSSSSGLTPGAIAGIAIGSVGAVLLGLVGWALVRLKRRKLDGSSDRKASNPDQDEKNLVGTELDGQGVYVELEALRATAEASGSHKDHAWEMVAETPPVELE